MKVHQSIIKLDKKQVNELLKLISEDNFRNGLILKLVYIYGRSIGDVLRLRKRDIDLKHNTIDFNLKNNVNRSFVLHKNIRSDLLNYINDYSSDDYLFIDVDDDFVVQDTNVYSNALNRYLELFLRFLNHDGVISWHCPSLVCTDFKVLRGQHLFVDGAPVKVVNDLYCNTNISSTKSMIRYGDLLNLRFPCDSIDKVFNVFTDLEVFHDERFVESDIFTICKGDLSVIVEYDYCLGDLTVIDCDDGLNAEDLFVFDSLVVDLLHDLDVGDYRFVDGLRVIKN